jgi:hypothetical protein
MELREMDFKYILGFITLALLLAADPVGAQDVSTPPPTEVSMSLPASNLSSIPPATRLEGLSPVYQQFNRCSAAALTIQLSYDTTIRALNPHSEDVAVRLDEMAAFARLQGLGAIDRIGGTPELMKALVAAGFPVRRSRP